MSLRFRLLVGVAAVALVALFATDFAVYTALRSSLIDGVDASLDSTRIPVVRLLANQQPGPNAPVAGVPPGGGTAREPGPLGTASGSTSDNAGPIGASFCSRVDSLSAGAYVALLGSNHKALSGHECAGRAPGGVEFEVDLAALSDLAGSAVASPSAGALRQAQLPAHYLDASATGGASALRVSVTHLPSGDTLVVALLLNPTNRALSNLLLIEIFTSTGALILAIGLGWWLVRVGLKPLREVETTAKAISAGDLTQRVPNDDRHTEVGQVARVINSMLAQIEKAFIERDATESELRASEQRLRQFVADASHELRTPITAVGAYSELFGKGASEHQEDLERVMAGIGDETRRMATLVEDLLFLARLDEGQPIEHQSVELVALASDAIRVAMTVGPDWPTRLEAREPIEIDGDVGRLRQVLDNLLSNVRAHTPPGTETIVRISRGKQGALVDVEDTGPGIPPEHIEHLFDRFFRVDPSRARTRGGSGLGLAIASSIVSAHGGEIEAENIEPHGTRFRVSLPFTGDHA